MVTSKFSLSTVLHHRLGQIAHLRFTVQAQYRFHNVVIGLVIDASDVLALDAGLLAAATLARCRPARSLSFDAFVAVMTTTGATKVEW